MFLFIFAVCLAALGSTNDAPFADEVSVVAMSGQNARELYNAGTRKLQAGKLDDAETLLESSIARQDLQVQPVALFNLGCVRFGQGKEMLKKSADAAATTGRTRVATLDGLFAIRNVENALGGNDVQQMVRAYLAGRGVHREMRAAMKAVQLAMEAHGNTLTKWRRALSDFQSAAELNPADTNAVRNAKIVEQAIARLVDSLRQMRQAGAKLGETQARLDALLKMLRGRIPAADMPPGAPGQGDEDEDGENGTLPEDLAGMKESPTGGGQEMGWKISPETAARLLNGVQPDGKLLPLGEGKTGKPQNRSGRNW